MLLGLSVAVFVQLGSYLLVVLLSGPLVVELVVFAQPLPVASARPLLVVSVPP